MDIDEKIKKLNKDCLNPLRRVINKNAKDRYYKKRSNANQFFSGIDTKLLKYIIDNYKTNIVICEPGCGYGQLLFGLGEFGFKCVGLEYAKWRHEGAIMIFDELSKTHPKIKNNVKILNKPYPDTSPKADLLVINNFVATIVKNCSKEIIKSFSNYKEVILDIERFGIVRSTEEEKKKFLKEIESYGFKSKKLYNFFYLLRKK